MVKFDLVNKKPFFLAILVLCAAVFYLILAKPVEKTSTHSAPDNQDDNPVNRSQTDQKKFPDQNHVNDENEGRDSSVSAVALQKKESVPTFTESSPKALSSESVGTKNLKGYVSFEGPFTELGRRGCDKSPSGWFIAGETPEDYTISIEDDAAFIESKTNSPRPHGELNHCVNFSFAPQQVLKITALVKGKGITGYSNFHIRAENEYHEWIENKKVSFSESFYWKKMVLELEIPEQTKRIIYGVTFESPGKIWIKDVVVTN